MKTSPDNDNLFEIYKSKLLRASSRLDIALLIVVLAVIIATILFSN